ncbi:MAG: RDD family protein [Bacillota bacterium]
MNKKEFLNELENALDGKLPQSDIGEIVSDYGDIFDSGAEDGKSEEEMAKELGSPAKIARTILEDGMDMRNSGKEFREHAETSAGNNGEREYTDFQKNINEKTSKIFDKVLEPDQYVKIEQLAPMSRRLGAYIIDGILLGVIVIGGLFAILAPFMYMVRTSSFTTTIDNVPANIGSEIVANNMMHMNGVTTGFAFGNMIIMVMLFGAFNLFTTIILWATNGYTPGKWMLKMRVVKINGEKISFLDALLRELVIKCIANSVLSGILNIVSFIWGCVTEDHKTVHDLVAHTRVVEWERFKDRGL